MKEPTDDHIPLESVTAPVAEDPDTLYRRRTEKNFSDLFGTKMGERKKIDSRMEVTGSKNCSFLDSRSEIARRNENKWRPDDDDKAEGSRGGGDNVAKSRVRCSPTTNVFVGTRAASWIQVLKLHGVRV